MYVLFENINDTIYKRCKTKNIFLKKIGYYMFSLEIIYNYEYNNNNIIFFSLKDNKIYFEIYNYEILLYYIFLKITSILNNYKTYVYVFSNSQNYMTLFNTITIILNDNMSPFESILNETNKPYFNYLIQNNIILKKNIDDGNNIHITSLLPTNVSIILKPTNKYIIDDKNDLHILKVYNRDIIDNYLKTNDNINIFFNTENVNLDVIIKSNIENIKCQSKRKKIKLSTKQKHTPLSFEKKRRSLNSITRKRKSNNFASITRKINRINNPSLKQKLGISSGPAFDKRIHIPNVPAFNKEDINIGLLIVTIHGGIIIESSEGDIRLPIVNLPVGRTKLYYKSITLPGYYNYFTPENKEIRRSLNSQENDFEYVGDSLLSDIEPIFQPSLLVNNKNHDMTFGHYRYTFESCFKKNPLYFDKIFYSCGNKIINKFLRASSRVLPHLRPQDNKMIDFSKLNKTTGPGPINTILDKVLEFGSDMKENTKLVFIVFNNSSKKFERYNLSDVRDLQNLFGSDLKTLALIMRIKFKTKIKLSSLIEMVLNYKKGLNSLYVYDASCSSYDSEVATRRITDIDIKIELLPADVGR